MKHATDSKNATARAGRKRKKRSKRFKIAAVLFSLLIAFSICEAMLRILLGAPLVQKLPVLQIEANAYRGWAMMPGTTHFAYQHPVHINNLGLRGDDVVDKQPSEIRILALGDSMVFGQGIADDQSLPVHMQARLNEREGAPPFTVINGGLRGYSTNQELGLLEEFGSTIKPDVVVLFWYWNDLQENAIAELNHRYTQMGPVAFDTKTKLEGSTLTKWRAIQLLRRSAMVMWLHDSMRALNGKAITPDQSQAGLVRLDGHLGKLQQFAKAQGFTPFLVVIPDPNSLKSDHPSTEYTLLVQAMAQKHGIASYDLFNDAMNAYDGGIRLPTLPYDGHYNSDANQAMANGVVKFLRKQVGEDWPRAAWQP